MGQKVEKSVSNKTRMYCRGKRFTQIDLKVYKSESVQSSDKINYRRYRSCWGRLTKKDLDYS